MLDTMVAVHKGLVASGRTLDDFRIVSEAIVCCGRDEAELATAEEGVRMLLSFYGSTPAYRPVLDAHGWGELQPRLRQMTREGRWSEMGSLIDDTMLRTLAIHGTPTRVAAELHDRFDGVADRVGFYFPYAIDDEVIGELLDALR